MPSHLGDDAIGIDVVGDKQITDRAGRRDEEVDLAVISSGEQLRFNLK
jgi:hypothetical protein